METETGLPIAPLKRRSRMRRTSRGKRVELTPRDFEIFKLLARYRYLRSTYTHAFVGGDKTKLIERLGHLYHEGGYLDRPEQQWQAINARYMPVVYELGEAGEQVLRENGEAALLGGRSSYQGKARLYHHELMVCDIVASIELATRADAGLRFISWKEILGSPKMPEATRNNPNPVAIEAPVTYVCPRTKSRIQIESPLIPDAVFGIEYNRDGQKSYRFFALEADRNTEPLVRGDFRQSSYLRKLLQYQAIVSQASYRLRWGLPNLFLLTVTTSDRHLQNLLRVVHDAIQTAGAAHLLFKAIPCLAAFESVPAPLQDLYTSPWRRIGLSDISL